MTFTKVSQHAALLKDVFSEEVDLIGQQASGTSAETCTVPVKWQTCSYTEIPTLVNNTRAANPKLMYRSMTFFMYQKYRLNADVPLQDLGNFL